MALRCALALLVTKDVAGHGMMTFPPSRQGGNLKDAAYTDMDDQIFNTASWFTQDATIPGEATNCGEYVTGIQCGARDDKTPWRAPGTTPVFSPCGGFCQNKGGVSPSGCDVGKKPDEQWDVRDGIDLPKTTRTVWTAGGTAKVAFALMYNHGGGYAYRLCPAGDAQTEACFQKTHLAFASNTTVVHWRNGEEASYPAVTMSTGTYPAGSQWRTVRIPSCSTMFPSICGHELLPKPCEKCCAHNCDTWDFSLMDEVVVPATLPPGDYTLSWRYDAEINHQVWQGCSDITLAAPGSTPPAASVPFASPLASPTPLAATQHGRAGRAAVGASVLVLNTDHAKLVCSVLVGRVAAITQNDHCASTYKVEGCSSWLDEVDVQLLADVVV